MAISLFSLKKSPTAKVTSLIDPTKFGGAVPGARKTLKSEVAEKTTAIQEVKELGYIRRALETLVSLEKRHYDIVTDSIKAFVLSEQKKQLREEEALQESKADKDKKKDEIKNPLLQEGKKRLEGLGNFFQGLMKIFIGYKILEWAAKPENGKKIQNIINFFGKLFNFIKVIGQGIATAFGATPIGIVLNNLPKAFELVIKVIGGIADFITFKWLGESIQGAGKLISDSINVLKSIPNAIGSLVEFISNLIPNFIESVLTEGLGGSKAQLESELKSDTTPAPVETSTSGEAAKPEGIDFGKLFGNSVKDVAGKVLEGLIPGGSLLSQVGKGISGMFGKKDSELPKLAKGGIVTKPTEAIVGEAGPEAILPLDKLGSFGVEQFKGQVDKQIPQFIKLLTLPFKIVGAGIVALISSSVSKIPGIGPMLMPLISNVASMFGIPPSLVKGMSNFASTAIKSVGQGMSAVKEVFGLEEPKISKTKPDEFKPSGDTSVRGLLGDILSALISKNSTGEKVKPTQTPPPAPTLPPPASTPSTPPAPAASAPAAKPASPDAAPAKEQKPEDKADESKLDKGGPIRGSGIGDKVKVLAEPGEYVLNKNATKAMGGPAVLDKVNYGLFPRFGGGPVATKKFLRIGGGWAPVPEDSKGVVMGRGLEHGYTARDLPMPVGTPLLSPFDGKIHEINKNPGGWGNYVVVKSNSGLFSLFGHVSSYTKKQGDTVKAGEQIASSGHQHGGGRSTGPHLHWEIGNSWNGTIGGKVEPIAWTSGKAVPSVTGQTTSTASTDAKTQDQNTTPEPTWSSVIPHLANLAKLLTGSSADAPPKESPETKITGSVPARSQQLQAAQRENQTIQAQRKASGAGGGNVISIPSPNKDITQTTTQQMGQALGGTTPPIPLATYPLAP